MATLQVLEEKPAPPPKEYVLTLSEAEARAVRLLVGAVGGKGALKKACWEVWSALESALPDVGGRALGTFDASPAMDAYVEGRE